MSIIKVRLDLPIEEEVLQSFDEMAKDRGIGLEAMIAAHLFRTRTIKDDNFIVLDEDQCRQIKRLVGAKISTADKLLDMLERLTKWKVGGMNIKLTPNQQEQILWYARSANKPVEEIGPMLVERAIARELKTR